MCDELPRIEAPLIAGLLNNFGDAAFAAAFDACGGLCRAHLAATLRAADAATARELATRQAAAWRRLEPSSTSSSASTTTASRARSSTPSAMSGGGRCGLSSGWYED